MSRQQLQQTAKELTGAISVVRGAFTRERLGGIETLGMQILLVLYLEDGLSLKDCAERLAVGPTNVSKAIAALESQGLVRRTSADHRTASLSLTKEGKSRVETFLSQQFPSEPPVRAIQ